MEGTHIGKNRLVQGELAEVTVFSSLANLYEP